MKRCIKKVPSIVSLFLCFLFIFNSTVSFAFDGFQSIKQNALTVTSVHGIVAGESLQLSSSDSDDTTDYNGIWSSSNPSVISCSENGEITGITAGNYADITCTAKNGASKTFRVYCVRAVYPQQKCTTNSFRNVIYAQPNNHKPISLHLNINVVFNFFQLLSKALSSFGVHLFNNSSNKILGLVGGYFVVYGQYGNYAYIRFEEDPTMDGFIKYTDLSKEIGSFLYISKSCLTVKTDGTNAYLKADYSGNVTWTVADDNADGTVDCENSIIKYDTATGKITAKKGGITSITASANGMSQTCEVYSIYMWPQEWEVTAEKKIMLYNSPNVLDINVEINEDSTFCVVGDSGGSNSWCYVKHGSDSRQEYSYAKIEDFSTKGTISQYNELGWVWPVNSVKSGVIQATKARYISSPYGWRNTDPARHKGVDITNGISSNSDFANSVDGYEVVSAFAGKVIYVCEDKYKSCGYCVAIRATEKDPITGKHYVAIYMHLKYIPDVELNENISANKKLGYVGGTGNSIGSHLHFEVNNQNLSYGQKIYYENNSDKEMVFGSVINPLFFYMSHYNLPESDLGKIKINPTCDAMDYRKPLWYGDDIKESKKP